MRSILHATVLLSSFGLSGCFTAEQAWLNDGNSVAPYQTITFAESDSTDVNVLTRTGNEYTMATEDTALTMRFMPLADRPDWYVVEVSGAEAGDIARLYAVLHVDPAAMTAATYLAIASDDDIGAGLTACQDDMVCIDDMDAYVDRALSLADAGSEPVEVYSITVE